MPVLISPDKFRLLLSYYCIHYYFLANVNVRYMLTAARLSSVTFVRPQAVQIFGSISTALGTLAIG